MRYRAIVRPGNESGFVAFIPALRGCVSQGPTREAALKNLHEAAQTYVNTLIDDVVRPGNLSWSFIAFYVRAAFSCSIFLPDTRLARFLNPCQIACIPGSPSDLRPRNPPMKPIPRT